MYAVARNTNQSKHASKGVALLGATVISAASIGLMPHAAPLPVSAKVTSVSVDLVAQVNPIETLLKALGTTGEGIQSVADKWKARPAPLMQQIISNWMDYGQIIAKSMTTEVTALKRYGNQLTDPAFVRQLVRNLQQGQIQAIYTSIAKILIPAGYTLVPPLSAIANIPAYMLTNLATTVKVLAGSGISAIGTAGFTVMLGTAGALATGLQGAIDSAKAGDLLGAVSNIANIPGLMVNNVLNGANGLLSPTGLLGQLATRIPQLIASTITSPGAINIFKGGTLKMAFNALSASITKLVSAITGMKIPAAAAGTATAAVAAKVTSAPTSLPSVTAAATANSVTLSLPAKSATATSTKTTQAKATKATKVAADTPAKSVEVKPVAPKADVTVMPISVPKAAGDDKATADEAKPATKPASPAKPSAAKPAATHTSESSSHDAAGNSKHASGAKSHAGRTK